MSVTTAAFGTGDRRAEIRAAVPPGTTRSELYRILRRRHLVGYNHVLAHYRILGGDSLRAIDRGEWPRPGQTPQPLPKSRADEYLFGMARRAFNVRHPAVMVHYTWGQIGYCAIEAFQTFTFDRADKVIRIEDTAPNRDCI
jgi:hypothetical protein